MTTSNTPYAELVKQLLESGDDVGVIGAIEALEAERDGAVERLRVRNETVAALNEALVSLQFKLSDADRRVEEERERVARLEHIIIYTSMDEVDKRLLRAADWHRDHPNATPDEKAAFAATWKPEADRIEVEVAAIRSRSNATGEDKDGVTAPATGRSPISQEGSIAPEALSEGVDP